MHKVLTAALIAAAVFAYPCAASADFNGVPAINPAPGVALPPPTTTCAKLVDRAHLNGVAIRASTIGKLYAVALVDAGIREDKQDSITPYRLIMAYSNLMTCFFKPPTPVKP